jgi:hypothetical protein
MSGLPWLIMTGSGLDDWIYWCLLLQSLLITITTAHNQWLPKIRSIPCWTTFAVADLVLIYESVTSSASVVLCLTLHSWTLNTLTNEWVLMCTPFILVTSGRTQYEPPPTTVPLLLCAYSLLGNVFTQPLPSNVRMRHNILPDNSTLSE